MRLWRLLLNERNNARNFLDSESRHQISLWFKSTGSYPQCSASCLALSRFTQEQGLKIPESVDPLPGRQGWGQDTSEGDTAVLTWELTHPAFTGPFQPVL